MRTAMAAGLTTLAIIGGLTAIGLAACNKTPAGAPASGQAAAPAAPSAPSANLLPQRKPGLWSQQIAVADSAHAMPAMQVCLDAASDAKLSMMGSQMSHKNCQTGQLTHNLDGSWAVSSSCDFGPGGKVVSNGVITGDFNNSYQVQLTSTTTGAAYAGANGEHKMTITSTYQGPCPAGWVGGDMMINGMKMNMLKAESGAKAMAGAAG
jgi:hypothetical protein